MSSAMVKINPSMLDFGDIDVGNASEQMTLKLTNNGHKSTQFVVDLGRNDLELIVDPMKGTIKPMETIEIQVEILGTHEGNFLKEFWIKSEPPQRVRLIGTFIMPKLVIEHPLTDFNLTLIEFPKTYYGAESMRTVVIKNNSSRPTMFCTMAENQKRTTYLDEARKTDNNLKSFYIKPKEGRLLAKHKYILRVSFVPKKFNNFNQKYCIFFLKIIKIDYREVTLDEKDVEVKTFSSNIEMDCYSIASLHTLEEFCPDDLLLENSVLRVCLYGEIETASVKLSPDAISISIIYITETHIRTFNIKNNSNQLPITVEYNNKVACIDIKPKIMHLKPNGSIDVTLYIKPKQIGKVERNVMLNLTFRNKDDITYNVGSACLKLTYEAKLNKSIDKPKVKTKFCTGITPAMTHEVGFLVDDVRFNTSLDMPVQAVVNKKYKSFNKNNNALIAFPNDRPGSLRTWKHDVPCKTIFASIPRTKDDVPAVDDRYIQNKHKYTEYLHSMEKKRQPIQVYREPSDYEITGKLDGFKREKIMPGECTIMPISRPFPKIFIPLPPEKLLGVHIIPKYIQLGKIAPYTSCSDYFKIENTNTFPIHISMKALSNSVVIKGKDKITIDPKVTNRINFDCYSHGLGKYYVPVYIIINECHVFDATVFAEVVPTTIKCNYKQILIDPKTDNAFFKIYNPVNCDIKYSIQVQDRNFRIVPQSGTVKARNSMFIRVEFLHQLHAICSSEIYLISQNGAKQIIKVIYPNEKAQIDISTDTVNFENIPFNTRANKDVVIRNYSGRTVMVKVTDPKPLPGIEVSPSTGSIEAKSDMHFNISVCFKVAMHFTCRVEIVVENYSYFVKVTGIVTYPDVRFEPDSIQIPKIVSGSYQRRVLRATNRGKSNIFLNFAFENYPELQITDTERNLIKPDLVVHPEEAVELYLEFKPQEPIVYSIFLPFIVNGVIGPPLLNNPDSLNPINYFENSDIYESLEKYPKSLPVVRIRCAAGKPLLKFSSLDLYFIRQIDKSHKFKMTNISTTCQMIFLSYENIENTPFKICTDRRQEIKVEKRPNYYKISLEPNEQVNFIISFHSQEFGSYKCMLPIYVDNFHDHCPFNYVKLSGDYPKSLITCTTDHIYLQTIPLLCRSTKEIELDCSMHKHECKISIDNKNNNLNVVIKGRKQVTDYRYLVNVIITFQPRREGSINTVITFSCTCAAECSIIVKSDVSNCMLLTYENSIQEKTNIKIQSTFPFYPGDGQDSIFHTEMEVILGIVERWLFSAFFHKYLFKIPDTISKYPFDIYKNKNTKNKSVVQLPLVQLLVNLTDTNILRYIIDGKSQPAHENLLERTIYDYEIYKNIIDYLLHEGVFVQELRPELLLTYEEYSLYIDRIVDTDNPSMDPKFSTETFYLRSKQIWIDLLLKMYKVFVFDRILNTPILRDTSITDAGSVVYANEFEEYLSKNSKYYADYNANEAKLMMWLNFHYKMQKKVLWPDEDLNLPNVRCFDSVHILMFATLTIAYCPYMLEDLKCFYTKKPNKEEQFNNACIITEVWNKIGLSFRIDIFSLIQCNIIEIIMLLTYLYDALPNFYTYETITLEALIGEASAYNMTVKNCGGVPILYAVIIFSEGYEQFEVDTDSLVIPPKQEKTLKIIYNAKHILKCKAILILSGEGCGYKYAKSKAFKLIGVPNIYNFSEEFDVKVNMYELVNHKLPISSPYSKAYSARTHYYFNDASKELDQFLSEKEMFEMDVPRQFVIEEECMFDENGVYTLNLKTCFVTFGNYTYYIYFVNEEAGDFCVKINVKSTLHKKSFENIDVKFNYSTLPIDENCHCFQCICLDGTLNLHCPNIIMVEVPCRNTFLIQGLKNMIQVFAKPNEQSFWNEHLVFPKGFYLLRNYLENTFEPHLVPFKNVIKTSVSYKVEIKGKHFVSQKDNFVISDVTAEGSVLIPIHRLVIENPDEEILTLTADHGQEIRMYRLKFVPRYK